MVWTRIEIDYLVDFYSKSNRLLISIFTVIVIDIVTLPYPRLSCRDAPPLECSVHCVRSHELPVSMHMHCTQLVMSLNTICQLVFWSVSLNPLPALSSGGPFEATSLCARARA